MPNQQGPNVIQQAPQQSSNPLASLFKVASLIPGAEPYAAAGNILFGGNGQMPQANVQQAQMAEKSGGEGVQAPEPVKLEAPAGLQDWLKDANNAQMLIGLLKQAGHL